MNSGKGCLGTQSLGRGWIFGFRLGKLCIRPDNDRTNAFRDHVFPGRITDGIDSVYAHDCLQLVNNEKRMIAVSDDDAVRMCLLIVAMLVFMGTEDRNFIPKHILDLVEDLDAWNVQKRPFGQVERKPKVQCNIQSIRFCLVFQDMDFGDFYKQQQLVGQRVGGDSTRYWLV
ncbi:hypothetical protein CTI12_AA147170 [Artemisia annua]|uniref:Uncharacterized protein n=1 Tax=Artemisia annua TaxID=35608 RepID=A0A2U1PIL7_ARTAN|nr:hypothetical protein CTI12_AA147170 [Artemisia annua]